MEQRRNLDVMKIIYKILLLSVLGLSLCFARASEKFATPNDFLSSKNSPYTKKIFSEDSKGSGNQSVKWKRRHKRRKRDKNRQSKRGR